MWICGMKIRFATNSSSPIEWAQWVACYIRCSLLQKNNKKSLPMSKTKLIWCFTTYFAYIWSMSRDDDLLSRVAHTTVYDVFEKRNIQLKNINNQNHWLLTIINTHSEANVAKLLICVRCFPMRWRYWLARPTKCCCCAVLAMTATHGTHRRPSYVLLHVWCSVSGARCVLWFACIVYIVALSVCKCSTCAS